MQTEVFCNKGSICIPAVFVIRNCSKFFKLELNLLVFPVVMVALALTPVNSFMKIVD